jgi:hypothetical protein
MKHNFTFLVGSINITVSSGAVSLQGNILNVKGLVFKGRYLARRQMTIFGSYFLDEDTSTSNSLLHIFYNYALRQQQRSTILQLNAVNSSFFSRWPWLSATFPSRSTGRVDTIFWPPHFPDITPLDFCLFGMWKTRYADRCSNCRSYCTSGKRWTMCKATNGAHF